MIINNLHAETAYYFYILLGFRFVRWNKSKIMKRRSCCAVIAEMMVKIPKENAELIKDLEWNFEDASYKAPEETLQWERTQQTLIKHLPKPTENWEFEVLSIFTTQPIDDLRRVVANEA